MSDLVIYLKTTNTCQMNCKHCYNSISPFKGTMTQETINNVITYLNDLSKNKTLLVIFHGGEPFNCDISIIQSFLKAFENNKNVSFTVTTNLMYKITDDHLNIFKKMDKLYDKPFISTSWDYNIRFATEAQENLWLNNVQYLQQNGIEVSPIVTLSKLLIDNKTPEDILNYFKQLNIKRMNIERITKTGNAEKNHYLIPLNKDVSEWLYEAYKLSIEMDIDIMLFNNLKQSIFYNNKVGCLKRQCQKNVITINPDGSIAGCPNCSQNIYGNIKGDFDSKLYNKFICDEEIKKNECYLCPYYEYCNGECFQLSWDESGCPGLKLIMDDMLNDLRR